MDKFDFGSKLVNSKGATTIPSTTKLVGLYFSAHWCPPCRGFTPVLTEFYKTVNKDEHVLEIIFASSDKDKDAWKEYYGTMPWIALDFEERDKKGEWSKHFGITGIPTFVMLKVDGTKIVDNARGDVAGAGSNADNCKKVVEGWLSK